MSEPIHVPNQIFDTIVPTAVTLERLALLESWLWSEASVGLQLGKLPKVEALAQQVMALSDLYTTQRTVGLSEAAQREHLQAKVLYFLLSDAVKLPVVLRELQDRRRALPMREPAVLRVLDLGAGVGATAVGLLTGLNPQRISRVEITAVDADASALRLAGKIAEQAARITGVRLEWRAISHDLTQPLPAEKAGAWNVCVSQAVVNELPLHEAGLGKAGDEKRTAWIGQFAAQGLTIILEPALRVTTHALHRARDLLLRQGDVRVLAPCPHQLDCPMLRQGDRDWCHEIRLLQPTAQVARVNAITRRRDERTKFSFVVLAPNDSPAAQSGLKFTMSSEHLEGRLVSDALNSKGKCERHLCSSSGQLVQLRLLDRERTDANALLADGSRGTLVRIDGTGNGPRVGSGVIVRDALRDR